MIIETEGESFKKFQDFHDAEIVRLSLDEARKLLLIELSNLYFLDDTGDEQYDPELSVYFLFSGVEGAEQFHLRDLVGGGVLSLSFEAERVILNTDRGSLRFQPRGLEFGYGSGPLRGVSLN